jgi:hypothetical protein
MSMARPKLPAGTAKDKVATVRLTPAMLGELEKLQRELAPPVELSMGQVLRAVIEAGIATVQQRHGEER